MLVQQELRRCKPFLLLLVHLGYEPSLQRCSMCHAAVFLLHRHRKVSKNPCPNKLGRLDFIETRRCTAAQVREKWRRGCKSEPGLSDLDDPSDAAPSSEPAQTTLEASLGGTRPLPALKQNRNVLPNIILKLRLGQAWRPRLTTACRLRREYRVALAHCTVGRHQ